MFEKLLFILRLNDKQLNTHQNKFNDTIHITKTASLPDATSHQCMTHDTIEGIRRIQSSKKIRLNVALQCDIYW